MSSCSPDYDEHFAALAAGYGPAALTDPDEPDGTARRARQRRADSREEQPATRAVRRRVVGERARRVALVGVAIVSLIASAGLAAQLLDRAQPASEATFDDSRAGTGMAHPSAGAATRSRTVRSSANRARRPSTSKARKSAPRRRARPHRASTERTPKRGRVRARPSPPARAPQPPVPQRPLTAPTPPTRPTRPAKPARDFACIEFPPC